MKQRKDFFLGGTVNKRLAAGNRSVPPPSFFNRLKLLRGSGGRFSPRAAVWRRQPTKVFLLTLILTLILILLPPKGGLGAQPQGFDFDSFA
ncbi:MAG: hypothetical protein HW380_3363, partial [Magnetococcales bacterium]|nr:hypothetical protein [Magnetococcales bacterium]